jgi:hypothetical protein
MLFEVAAPLAVLAGAFVVTLLHVTRHWGE